jgi:mono/diheme cytochrome c family protein
MSERKNVRTMIVIAILSLVAASCTSSGAADRSHYTASMAERGQYLVTIGGCNDCHTPWKLGPKGPEPDMTRMLSGHPQNLQMPPAAATSGPWGWSGAVTNTAFAGPWGVSYAFNLTPDEQTGIGIWSEDIFIKTIRTGRHWGVARPILPPMPWSNYGQMTDEDLRAVYAYLRSIPPVNNKVPDAVIVEQQATN